MKASELRIGNWINFNNKIGGQVHGVDINGNYQITPLFFRGEREDFEINNYYRPIPLNEEWLLKFGFEKRSHLYSVDIDRYNKINYNSDQKIFFSGQLGFSIQHDIQYVHQLQNLYKALTNEELKLNEKL